MKKLFTLSFITVVFLIFLGCSSDDSESSPPPDTIIPTPKSMVINRVIINDMPYVNGFGSQWDVSPFSEPDVKIYFKDSKNGSRIKISSIFNNVSKAKLPLTWSETDPLLSINVSDFVNIELLEIDEFTEESIGWLIFLVEDITTSSNPYPKTFTKTRTTLDGRITTITFDVTWK